MYNIIITQLVFVKRLKSFKMFFWGLVPGKPKARRPKLMAQRQRTSVSLPRRAYPFALGSMAFCYRKAPYLPSGKLTQLWKITILTGKSTISGHFQQQTVSLPEGNGKIYGFPVDFPANPLMSLFFDRTPAIENPTFIHHMAEQWEFHINIPSGDLTQLLKMDHRNS